ncbi:hypothetical protein ACFUC1_10040 [Pedococcus sp. NPDC057267]|uniref:hypothetical protein n=1 Tax=Pedococcus sp. NPDC057267 TaxID=3346077 RepID=UPI00363BAE92
MTAPTEDQVVRQYRYLLATAPADALQAAHVEALEALDDRGREAVLRAVQDGLVAGGRLRPGDTAAVARLVVHGELRAPGTFRTACEPSTLRDLADGVVGSEAAFGLFVGYADWDGADRVPADPGVDHGGAPGRGGDPAAQAWAYARAHAAQQAGFGAGSV